MNFDLTEEQLAFKAMAKNFAEKELAPFAAEWDAQAIFPVETLHKAGALGLCGIYTAEAEGGMGLSRLDASLIFEELSRACTSTTAFLTIHNMATWMVASFGQTALKKIWCPQLTSGKKLASYCLTEPNAGSDAASLRTTAEKEGTHYILNGSKAFISGAGATDALVVMARTGGKGASGISSFLVPAEVAGIHYGRKEEKMGWNSQPTRAITFENVKIPVANRLGEEGDGFKIAMRGLDGGRINIASCSLGTATAAIQQAQSYLQARKQFGQALAEFQALQFKLADMVTELTAARQMVRLAAFKLDQQNIEATLHCAMAKRFATDVCFNICNQALQIFGGYGYIREYPLERYVRDVRVHQILEGTNEIMRVIIAKRLLLQNALEHLQ